MAKTAQVEVDLVVSQLQDRIQKQVGAIQDLQRQNKALTTEAQRLRSIDSQSMLEKDNVELRKELAQLRQQTYDMGQAAAPSHTHIRIRHRRSFYICTRSHDHIIPAGTRRNEAEI